LALKSVRSHPFFWNWSDVQKIVREISDTIVEKKESPDLNEKTCAKDIEGRYKQAMMPKLEGRNGGWESLLPEAWVKDPQIVKEELRREYYKSNGSTLLRVIRNIVSHKRFASNTDIMNNLYDLLIQGDGFFILSELWKICTTDPCHIIRWDPREGIDVDISRYSLT
jgi:hypothetical protein